MCVCVCVCKYTHTNVLHNTETVVGSAVNIACQENFFACSWFASPALTL